MRRRWSVTGIADRVKDLGVIAGAVAPKLSFRKLWKVLDCKLRESRKKL